MGKKLFLLFFMLVLVSCDQIFNSNQKIVKKEEKKVPAIEEIQNDIAKIVEKTTPSIVTIFSYPKTKYEKMKIFNYFDDSPQYNNESLGSGFVIKKDNQYLYISTNTHVIEKSNMITVRFFNNVEKNAEVVGTDSKTDIAVLKVKIDDEIKNINPIPFANPSDIKIGYFVIAAGSPYNLGHTFTFGIISAVGRSLGISNYENFIQTDAAINPGDSGGPLINIKGKVVGMNTAIIQTGQGLGFAIPVSIVKQITQELILHGKVIRGWLGVLVQDLYPKMKEKYKINHGVIVIKVFKNSPAFKSGLNVGDIILSVDNKEIKNSHDIKNIISNLKPGQIISIKLIRHGIEQQIKVKIEKTPKEN